MRRLRPRKDQTFFVSVDTFQIFFICQSSQRQVQQVSSSQPGVRVPLGVHIQFTGDTQLVPIVFAK